MRVMKMERAMSAARSSLMPLAIAAVAAAFHPHPVHGREAAQQFLQGQQPDQILASNVFLAPVMDPDGTQIGNVADLLYDTQGRVVAVVMDVGGFLGVGTRRVAIPVDALEFGLVGDSAAEPLPQWGPPGTPIVVPGAGTGPVPREALGWRGITGGQIEYVRVPFDRQQLEAAPEFVEAR